MHQTPLDSSRNSAPPAPGHNDLPVAVIGAGISGLIAARTLHRQGLEVTVFEKSRGPGGRTATRRHHQHAFDHGAQYFTVRDPRFRHAVDSWRDQNVVERWDGRIAVVNQGDIKLLGRDHERFVGAPRMSAIAGHLASGLDVTYSLRIGKVQRDAQTWRLTSDEGVSLGTFGTVILAIPPAQAVPLLADAPQLADRARAVSLLPCWAVMAVFETPLDLAFEAAFAEASPLSWIANNSSKPGRPGTACWVLHASPEWSARHRETVPVEITQRLLRAFFEATALQPPKPHFIRAHRWLYSIASSPLQEGCLWDPTLRIGTCGDWCQGSRVEGAFLSGTEIARRILG